VLGPVVVIGPQGPVALGPTKQRLLLAVLLTRPGAVVTTVELVDSLWGAAPPPSARENLRSYIHHLRRLLGADRLTGGGRPGYGLHVDVGELDAADAADLVRTGLAALTAGDAAGGGAQLRQALALWRGEPFAGLDESPALAAEVARLQELRLTALEHRIGADLDQGCSAEVTAELTELVRAYPYRERFGAQLMIALYRSGRQADALTTYRALRDQLADDLGIEPGADLRELHRAILRNDVALDLPDTTQRGPTGVVPAELPAATGHFVRRDAELRRLTALTTARPAPGVPIVVTVVGPAGVGKTTLALHWAHRAVDRFPDGQLHSDLRGFHRRPAADPHEILARFLRALGVPAERVPGDTDEAAASYRSLLAGRRMLVILDNAANAGQVRPLLPGTADCTVLVTSRTRMPGLVTAGGAELTVGRMSGPDAVEVLAAVLGAHRVNAEPGPAAELATACGHLPLALQIAAASLAARPERSIAEHVAMMRSGDRLDALRLDGDADLAVRSAFDLSYRALPPARRRLFRLAGLVPGADFTAPAAAALADASTDGIRHDLDALVDVHLVECMLPGRYRLHDLVREYAAGLARVDDSTGADAALGRLYRHYHATADASARLLYEHLLRLPQPDPIPPSPPLDRTGALAWLTAEHANVAAASRHAAVEGPRPLSWLLADALRGYWSSRRSNAEWRATAKAALAAADEAGNEWAGAAMRISLAHCYTLARDYPRALAHGRHARGLCARLGWQRGEATALGNLCAVYADIGDLDRAAMHSREALEVHRKTGWRPGECTMLSNLGMMYANLGRLHDAVATLTEALALLRQDPPLVSAQAVALVNLGEVYLLMDRLDEAGATIADAERASRTADRLDTDIYTLVLRSNLSRATGNGDGALDFAVQALRRADGTDNRLVSLAHCAAGAAYALGGRHRSAVAHYRRASRLVRQTRSRFFQIEALVGLAGALHPIGPQSAAEAARVAERAAADAHDSGYAVLEGLAITVLVEIEAGRGATDAARSHAQRALVIQDRTGWRLGRDALARRTDRQS
jgi:DNA-binding SARP family transcriptional activator/tetratricopeptide (TPR) repeat protein